MKLHIGKRIGSWKILAKLPKEKFLLRCRCGTVKKIRKYNLLSGFSKSCGCSRITNYQPGYKFGHFTVISKTKKRNPIGMILYKCRCICGKIKLVPSSNITQSTPGSSCGCKRGFSNLKDIKQRVLTLVYHSFKTSAKVREYEFNLTKRYVDILINKPCYYCGAIGSNLFNLGARVHSKFHKGTYYRYNGIDRLNNNKGYINGNVVPCCITCNMMKQKLTKKAFLSQCHKITKYTKRYGKNK